MRVADGEVGLSPDDRSGFVKCFHVIVGMVRTRIWRQGDEKMPREAGATGRGGPEQPPETTSPTGSAGRSLDSGVLSFGRVETVVLVPVGG